MAQTPATEPPEVLGRALAEAQAGRLEEAVAILEPVAGQSDADPRLAAALGALYIRLDQPQKALEILEPLTRSSDADAAVLYNAGVAALRTGQVDQAESLLSRSIQTMPGSPAARLLGLVYQAQGRPEKAYLLLKPWVLQNPEDTEARVAAAMAAVFLHRASEAEELLADLPTEDPEIRLIWAKIFLQKGDTWSALAMALPVLETAPPSLQSELLVVVADSYLALQQPESVVDTLKDKVKGRPRLAWRLGEAKRQSGDLAGGIATLEPFAEHLLSAQAPPPEEVPGAQSQLLLVYGHLLLEADRAADAVPVLERAVGLANGSSLAWSALGQALAAVGRTDEAKAAEVRASELLVATGAIVDPQAEAGGEAPDAVARALRQAHMRLAAGNSEEALALLRKEQKLNPGDIRPYLVEAQMLLELGRKLPALQVTHLTLQAFPGNADALYFRGVVNMARQELELAEADFRKALAAAPEHTAAMGDLAVLLMSQGRNDEARALWEQVLALRPGDPVATENLARLK
jgi:Flp pilus assembly protein TadD